MDRYGAVVASTMYCDGELVAKDVEFTLPDAAFQTVDVQAMGTMSVPVIGLLDNMELTVNHIGVDVNVAKACRPGKNSLEFRWVQQIIKDDGSVAEKGCKAFVTTLSNRAYPSINAVVGSATTLEGSYTVVRIQIFADGQEVLLVDRVANILKANGIDYMNDRATML